MCANPKLHIVVPIDGVVAGIVIDAVVGIVVGAGVVVVAPATAVSGLKSRIYPIRPNH